MYTKTFGSNAIRAFAIAMLFAANPVSVIGTAQAQEANSVVIKNFDFAPMTITIKAGSSVTWKNFDGEPHTVTSVDGLFRSGAIDQNESFTFKFDKPGTYQYLCSIHPRMRAAVIVQ
jgi:plastocyanin